MPMRSELRIPSAAHTEAWSRSSSSRQSIGGGSQGSDLQLILLIAALGFLLSVLLVQFVPLPSDLVGAFALS
jgi:hypothetical protein